MSTAGISVWIWPEIKITPVHRQCPLIANCTLTSVDRHAVNFSFLGLNNPPWHKWLWIFPKIIILLDINGCEHFQRLFPTDQLKVVFMQMAYTCNYSPSLAVEPLSYMYTACALIPIMRRKLPTTVQPRYTEPPYNDVLGITNDILCPRNRKINGK